MATTLRLTVVVLMLITALALGMIGFRIVRPQMVQIPAQPLSAEPTTMLTGYFTAARPLPAGTLARDEDFALRQAPSAQLPEGAIVDGAEARAGLRGALVRSFLDAGRMVTMEDVIRPRDRGFIASVLDDGTRAVSIGVDPVTGVSGLIWPGDRVDVILTQELEHAPVARRVMSETIMEDARVIGIDQDIVQGVGAEKAVAGKLARTVTLQVSPDQAEKLTVAQRLGKLTLAIRPVRAGGAGMPWDKPTTFGADVSPALSQSEAPRGAVVNVVEGDHRKEVTFR